jgi:ubiquitin-conjugating enzyme E2 Q
MARKAFLADVVAASEKNIPNVISISRGDDDGDINFCYIHETAEPVEIGLLAMGTFSCLRRSTSPAFLSCFLVVS